MENEEEESGRNFLCKRTIVLVNPRGNIIRTIVDPQLQFHNVEYIQGILIKELKRIFHIIKQS